MLKKILALVLLCLGTIAIVNADENAGYLYSVYGNVIKDGYGQCVHTLYYDDKHVIAECGDTATSSQSNDKK